MTNDDDLKPGDWLSFYATMSVISDPLGWIRPTLVTYGSELEVTQQLLDVYEYPGKGSWLHRVDQPGRDGTVKVRRGRWNEDEPRTAPGSPERYEERERARQIAWSEPDRAQQARLLKLVDEKYGPGPSQQSEIHFHGGFKTQAELRALRGEVG